jgi:hypothetical protein
MLAFSFATTSAHQSESGKGLVHGGLFHGLSSFEQSPKWRDCIFCFQEREVRNNAPSGVVLFL